jgi:hypothetical protein
MNLENFIRFRRFIRQLGGDIISKQFKRQHSGHKWLSSFTALSFTFFSAFPALPNEMPLDVKAEPAVEVVEETKPPSEEICDFKKDIRGIQEAIGETPEQEELQCGKEVQTEIVIDTQSADELAIEVTIEEIASGHPLQEMAPSIARFDKSVAGLLVGIAKKESNWGKHSPSKGGEDCFNYWGYKGSGGRGTAMGYACFSTREEAVETVGNRLVRLVEARSSSAPSSLVTSWKCGNSCATHSKESVSKWISDVQQYYSQIALR